MVLQTVCPGAELHPFGSSVTGLRLPYGDLDLMIQAPQHRNRPRFLHMMADALHHAKVPSQLLVIPKANVPIIKWTDKLTGVKVDACVNAPNGLSTTAMLARSAAALPQLKPLVLVLKSQLLMHNLHETRTGGVGGYLLANMVRQLLVTGPHLGTPEPRDLGGWLLRFYWHYGYSFDNEAALLDDDNAYTGDSGNYSKRRAEQARAADLVLPNSISLLDPANPSVDIGTKAFKFHQVRHLLRSSYMSLLGELNSPALSAPQQQQLRELRTKHFGDGASVADTSSDGDDGATHQQRVRAQRRAAKQRAGRPMLSVVLPGWHSLDHSSRTARQKQKQLVKVKRQRQEAETKLDHLSARLEAGDVDVDPLWQQDRPLW